MAKQNVGSIMNIFLTVIIGASVVGVIGTIVANAPTAALGYYMWPHNGSFHSTVKNVSGLGGAELTLLGILALLFVVIIIYTMTKRLR